MARYAYRCMECRTRNMFNKPVAEYVRQRKCKACGNTCFYWDKERNKRTFVNRDDVCYCMSPYGHPHRRGSRWCEHNPDCEFNIRVDIQGETPSTARIAMALEGRGGEVCHEPPF